MNSLKICATSDTHGNKFQIPPCDVFCHCGDWSPLHLQSDMICMQEWLEEFVTSLCSLPCKYVVIIAGNHDLIMQSMLGKNIFQSIQYRLGLTTTFVGDDGLPKTVCKVHYLDRDSVKLDGWTFWGSPVTKQFSRFTKRWAFETHLPAYDIPDDVDVILTHQPSDYGGLGNTYWRKRQKSKRLGSKTLTEAVLKTNAKLHLCGHIHTGNHDGVIYKNQAQTFGCNVSMLDEDYQVFCVPKVFEIEKGEISV